MMNNVAVIGAGTMGHGIALQFALNGTPTMLYDQSEQALHHALEKMKTTLHIFEKERYKLKYSLEEIIDLITFTTNINDLKEVDFITECVIENLEIKQKIFKELDLLCKAETIFASNTSSLKLNDIFKDVNQHKTKCLLTHWFNPPHIVPLVELLKNDDTEDRVFNLVKDFLEMNGKVTITVKKEVPGLVANRIQVAMAREVLSLLEEGVASPKDLDLAITGGPGFRLSVSGLLEVIDFGGIDVWNKVIEELQPEIASHQSAYQVIQEKIANGHFGVKTGSGFYAYPGKSFDEYTLERDRNLLKHLLNTPKFSQ